MKTELLATIIEKTEKIGEIIFNISYLLLCELLFILVSGSLIFGASYVLSDSSQLTLIAKMFAFGFGLFGFVALGWGLFVFTYLLITEIKDIKNPISFD